MRWGPFLAGVLLLTGCGAAEPAGPAPSAPASTPARSAGDHRLTMTVGGTERTYLLHAPPGYDPARAPAAVIALHYRPGSAQAMRDVSGLDAKADREGFLVAYPEGVGGQFNGFGCCGAQDDVGFVKAVAAALVADWKADPARLFLAGVSNGAELSFRAAVEVPGVFAAIGVVSGGFHSGRTEDAGYKPTGPVSVVTLIGGADPMAETLRAGIDTWRKRLGCTPAEGGAPPADPTVHRTSTRCTDGSTVDAYVIDGAAHIWFGAKRGELVDPAPKIDATDVLWTFFAAHPRR
jgi:polyhydroxybutyrate depolymerase